MKYISAILQKLRSPATIGIFVTFAIIATIFNYYIEKSRISKDSHHNVILKLLKIIDEKTIDFRLISRGPRFGSSDVALLTVDEKAVSTVGRWPWSREVTAQAIENAIRFGAKVIAFDIVFSESTSNPVLEVYEKFDKLGIVNDNLKTLFATEIQERNADEKLSKVLTNYSNNIVAGTFFNNSIRYTSADSYKQICRNWIHEQSEAFIAWDREEHIVSTRDPSLIYIPEILQESYKKHLKDIEEEIRQNQPVQLTPAQILNLENEIYLHKHFFCENWLTENKDETYPLFSENWSEIRESIGNNFPFESFEDFTNDLKNRSLNNAVLEADHWVMNTPTISLGVKHTGFFNAQQDMDGTIRRSRLIVRSGEQYMPSIALKAFLVANNYYAEVRLAPDINNPGFKIIEKLTLIDADTGDEVPDYHIPIDEEGLLQINYAGPRQMFSYISLADLLDESEDMEIEQSEINPKTNTLFPEAKVKKVNKSEFLKDKLLILGATAMGIFDLRVSPFDENFPGAETHVNVLDNLVRKDFLASSKQEPVYMLTTLIGLGLVMSFLLSHLGALYGLFITLLSLIGIALFDKFFLFEKGIIVSIVFPLALTFSLYVILTFYKYFTEERNKKELRSTFQKYVSPAIVDEVLKNPKNLELGGRKENITVLFSDVRGFTTISEKLDPRALSDLLNSYLTPMTDLVFANRGTLDKYMGDAVMAFFGAPIQYPDHAAHACRCALQMLDKLFELQEGYRRQGLPEIDIGIGLNTGECSVGNMGSQTVRSYTVMGDSVNLGSRLEGINKQYGTRIIISEFTYAHIKDQFVCREIDLVRVKGKALPVKIYELIAEGTPKSEVKEKVDHFSKGYQLFHQREFNAAIEQFNITLQTDPNDYCSKLYIERCQEALVNPPPPDWDGVFIMTTK